MVQHAPAVPAPRAAVPAPVQAKLAVGPANDHFERQADSVAAAVMRAPGPIAIPPTISPIGAQRQAAPAPKPREEKKKAPKASAGARAQRKAASPPPKKEKPKKAPAAKVTAQRKAAPSRAEEKKKPAAGPGKTRTAQREAAAGAEGGTASASADSAIQAMRSGPASRLDPSTQSFMESRFGRDFSGVRIHHGARAAEAADAIGARAFTTGNDIFFNAGQYQPNSSGGRQLIAHELTHTVQQGGGTGVAARALIQRTPPPAAPIAGTGGTQPTKEPVPPDGVLAFTLQTGGPVTDGEIKTASGQQEIVLPYLNLPTLDNALKGTPSESMTPATVSGPLPTQNGSYTVTGTTPRTMQAITRWLQGTRTREFSRLVAARLEALLPPATNAPTTPPASDPLRMSNGFYVLGFRNPAEAPSGESFIWGTIEDLAKAQIVLAPRWTRTGGAAGFEADHMLELQLGGADTFENLWLLEAGYNGTIGPMIAGRIKTDATNAVTAVKNRYELGSLTLPPGNVIAESWKKTFLHLRDPGMPNTSRFWSKQHIQDGEQLHKLKFLTSTDLRQRGFQPSLTGAPPEHVYLFPTPNGGKMWRLRVGQNRQLEVPANNFFYYNMTLVGGELAADEGNRLANLRVLWMKTRRDANGRAQRSGGQVVRDPVQKTVEVDKLEGFVDVGYVTTRSVQDARTGWDLEGMSPVEFSDIALDSEGYLVGNGTLSATKALLPGLRADVQMLPRELRIDFPIPMESFSLGPVQVTSLAMSLGVGESGPFLRGAAGFAVNGLGQGTVTAEVSPDGPVIAGQFNLDADFLDPAAIDVRYNFATDEFLASATLGVARGRIPGLDSGTVTVAMTRDHLDVTGTLNLGGPLQGTVINVGYTREEGLRIGADNVPVPLSNLPAVQNATMSFSAAKPPDGDWQFSGTGTATLVAPGATGTLNLAYANGAFTVTGQGQVARGPATGTLNFTATNRQIDEQGAPIEGPPTEGVNVWGRGSVTVRFGNFITGTAGIEYTPDQRIILSGAIALPPAYDLFPRRDYSRNLFTLAPPEFPIWGVSVAGVGVGIMAFVEATVAFNAYVGPGQIRNARIGATMDLDRPEDATITGHGEFVVPAYAGLSLEIAGGLRARAAVAFVEGRVGLTGALGIQAGATAAVDISWSRQAGLALDANLSAEARPKFELSANASVTVGVDLWVTEATHTYGPWRRQLGSFGPDMTLGVRMPVRWSEANGLDLNIDNIEVQEPSLDAAALMSSVFDQLAA
jgi:hypothetical protein